MPVDVSMYPGPPKPVNPLEMFSQVAGLQGQMQQNQLMQRTMAAKQAVGQAAQQNVGQDGQIDTAGFMRQVAGDPNAAYGAVEAGQNALSMQQAQLAQHVQQVQLGMQQQQYITQQTGALADTPGVTGKMVADRIGQIVSDKIISPEMAAHELAAKPVDDAQLPQYLRGLQKRSIAAEQQLALYHHTLLQNIGGSIQPLNDAPFGNQQPVATTLSPEGAGQPVAGPVTDQGAPTSITFGQRAGMGTVQTGPSPSQSAAGQVTGASNAQRAQELGKAAAQAPDTKAILGNMSGDLKQFQSGPGASQWKNLVAGVNRMFPGAVEPGAIANQENFNKLQTLLSQRSFAALGGTGTDAKLESAMHANPNETISVLGNQGIIALNKGFADAIALKNNLWQKALKAGQNPDTYGQFENSFNQRYDPRVFQFQYLDKKGQDQALSGMTTAEKAQFYVKQHYAEQKHWVSGGK